MSDPFDNLIGNSAVKSYVRRMIDRKAISQSLLFAGPDGVGKGHFARAVAQAIIAKDDSKAAEKVWNNTHPDLHIYRPEGKIGMHSIGSMRTFSEEVYMAPYEACKKIFIIEDAERMLTYSANALLKTFEEPAKDAIIILTSSTPNWLLPTVRSRCTTVHFHAVETDEIADFLIRSKELKLEQAHEIARKGKGSVAKSIEIAEKGDDPLCLAVLDLLVYPPKAYKELSQAVKAIALQMENRLKEVEQGIRAEVDRVPKEQMTAVLKESIEKEVEGAGAMQQSREADVVFETIQGWFRDLHLIAVNGNREYLIHVDLVESLVKSAEKGNLVSMEEVEKAVKNAQVSLMRSTAFSSCLEALLLKLIKI